ncbi:leucine-rich repeat domain-containing protein [Anaerosacchariphilus polymeriproducens]|uniref:Leucine-rich repeat domain-containing protein n=1 Tax=Anaerosacchariphilus polymeriproducens TaxID=1812858 RepID=A0A371AXC5_9FIRM|nr:leucine-rich repeat domain-containing protein [Anaerosacchariphilus polymeriproducens]RDU24234.1 leucine-rich repeat domain-containing protein [Anaerosacchariphilus polymeriproducens]
MKILKTIGKILLPVLVIAGIIFIINKFWGTDILYRVSPELYLKRIMNNEQKVYENSWLNLTCKNRDKLGQDTQYWEEAKLCFFPNTKKEISIIAGQNAQQYTISIPQGGIENFGFEKTVLREQLTKDLNVDFQKQYQEDNVILDIKNLNKDLHTIWKSTIKHINVKKGGKVKQYKEGKSKELKKITVILKKEEVEKFLKSASETMDADKNLGTVLKKITKYQKDFLLLEDVEINFYINDADQIGETECYLYANYKGAVTKINLGGTFYDKEKSYGTSDLYLTLDNGKSKNRYSLTINGTFEKNKVQSDIVLGKFQNGKKNDYKLHIDYQLTSGEKTVTANNYFELGANKQEESAFQCAEFIVNNYYPKYKKAWKEYLDKYEHFKETLALTPLRGARIFKEMKEVNGFIILNNNILIGYTGKEANVKVPNDIVKIARSAFKNNKLIRKITVPETVIDIEQEGFAGCSSLQTVKLPTSLRTIGESAFKGCNSLTAVSIPIGVERIEENTFQGCSNLGNVSIPDSVTYIGENAFLSCNNINKLKIPKSVTEIGKDAFKDTQWIASKTGDFIILGDNILYKYNGNKQKVKIPEEVNCIGGAFADNQTVQNITLSKSVKILGAGAFYNCTNLTKIKFSDGLSKIGKEAFYGCKGLKTISLPDSVSSIEENAFAECTSLEQMNLNDSIGTIGKGAFLNCKKLKAIYLPESIVEISEDTYSGCSSLVSVTMSDKLTKIDYRAFYQCDAISSISLSSGLTDLDEMAFEGCKNLKKVYVANGVVPDFKNNLKLNLVEK